MPEGMAQRIMALRKQKGLSLEQVASVVCVGKSTVRKWETGIIANMKRDKIAALAKALGTTPEYLMGWDDSPGEPALTEEEQEALKLFRAIPKDRRGEAIDLLRIALKMQKTP